MEREWKPSKFNEYLGEFQKENWVIYNNLSGAMIEVGKELYQSIRLNKMESISEPGIIQNLLHGKIIVPKVVDETQAMKDVREKYIKDVTSIGLQILPTTSCCHQCVYCYQQPSIKSSVISEEVMGAIVSFLKRKITKSTEYFNVMWYGGEPLLAVKQIQQLSKQFIEISDINNIKYHSAMITNGYLLTEENIEILLDNKINVCQITIDGPEKIHDSRRMLRGGGKTWKRTMENVTNAIAAGLKVIIRRNVDKENIEYVEELAEVFSKYGILNHIGMSFGLVTRCGKVCQSIDDTLLSVDHANEILKKKEIQRLFNLKDKGLRRIRPDFIGCVATAANSIIIGPDGELYKCSKNIGNLKERCGTIFQFDDTHYNLTKWYSCNPLNISSCKNCSLLPICKGTDCAFEHIIEHKNIFECNFKERHEKHVDHLSSLYRQKKHSNVHIN